MQMRKLRLRAGSAAGLLAPGCLVWGWGAGGPAERGFCLCALEKAVTVLLLDLGEHRGHGPARIRGSGNTVGSG